MIRIIVRTDDAAMAANVGGAVLTSYQTFDVDLPAIEAVLQKNKNSYSHSQIVGAEILERAP